MKTISPILYAVVAFLISTFVVSCIGDNSSSSDEHVDSISLTTSANDVNVKRSMLWSYDAEADSMVKTEVLDSLPLHVVLDTLNKRFNTANLQIEKQSGDTLYVKVNDVSFLQQLGSSGNYGFMAEVVYSLTEFSDVSYVFLNFEEVDHAIPGLYSRKDFDNKFIP